MKAIKKAKVSAEDEAELAARIVQEPPTPRPAQKAKASPPPRAETESGAEIVAEIGGPSPSAIPVSEADDNVVPAAIAQAESLEIVFLERMFDYPVIGKYNFQQEFGVSTIRKFQKFIVPRHVALSLYEKGWVTIPGMS